MISLFNLIRAPNEVVKVRGTGFYGRNASGFFINEVAFAKAAALADVPICP